MVMSKSMGREQSPVPELQQGTPLSSYKDSGVTSAEIMSMIHSVTDKWLEQLEGIPVMVKVTDRDGHITGIMGDPSLKRLALESSTPDLTPLKSYTVPLPEEEDFQGLGAISIVTTAVHAHPLFNAMLVSAVQSLENEIRLLKELKEAASRCRMADAYRHMAYHDDLTGLPNRRHLAMTIPELIDKAKCNQHMLAVLYLDLDRFKQVNDGYGHSQGDALLKEVAEELQNVLPQGVVVRMGGDEFTILLPEIAQQEEAMQAAERVLGCLDRDVNIGSSSFKMSVSIGISCYPQDGLEAETLLEHADLAMYQAKSSGKNQYRMYSPAMNRSLVQLSLQSRLHNPSGAGAAVLRRYPTPARSRNRKLFFPKGLPL
ncbi:diguanylate cyclase domain-containing protein [Paenibacillus sp. SAFN-117]|uniref:diguanylate cyclase domain-containing protein n=1 Tax=Paenibacillus sp. SAFN-117 TaxID=3436860 RepID=UPI003F815183